MAQTVQLSRVAVEKLFGVFNHTVDLRLSDRVTILHGPNGIGKTVLLRLIHAFFGGRYDYLLETNFSQLFVDLSDGRSLVIRRPIRSNTSAEPRRVLEIENMSSSNEAFQWSRDRENYRRMADYIDSEVSTITRVAEELWSDDTTGETYTIPQLVERFRELLPEKLKTLLTNDPEWLREFRREVSVHLVETQRLLLANQELDARRYRPRSMARRPFSSTVKTYSSNLKMRMAGALTAYAEHSQVLDRSFPQRLLGGTKTEALDTVSLKDRMNKLEKRRTQLKQIGLIEDDASYPFDINTLDSATQTEKAVMSLYVEDTESKLSVLDGLEEKVYLLLSNINRKFRPNKQLKADKNYGLIVRDRRDLRIDLDSLSSGEQHELVLIYDLLFQVKPHSLVLIDEPELSLHVTWQKAFLTEIFAIINAVDFDVLLATHSPFIVGERIDLMVPLAIDEASEELFDDSAVAATA